MGHLNFMKREYQQLHGRLNKGNVGMPTPEDPDARAAMYEILRILFSPQDAELASRMPLTPSSAKKIARLVDRPVAEIEGQLEAMAEKGLLFDLIKPDSGKTYYGLAPTVVGFFEFSFMRRREDIPQKKLAEAMHRYMRGDPAFTEEVAGETPVMRTLVHETALNPEIETEVLSYERASEIIRTSKQHAVSLCYCRHKAEHQGTACDTPQEICLSMNGGAEWVLRRGFGRQSDRAEQLDILDRSREMGLVQTGDNVKNRPSFMCNCCGCCCMLLTSINTYGVSDILKTSNYLAQIDVETCNGCSRCARACPVHAISMHATPTSAKRKRAMVGQIDESVCLGCGVCVDTCRQEAMAMKARPQRVLTPESTLARVVSQAIERGRLQHFLFDTAAKPTMIRRTLTALMGLEPARKIMASKQVKSRFIKQALERTRGLDI